MDNQAVNQPVPKQRSKTGLVILVIIIVVSIALMIYFFNLVSGSINEISNSNQTKEFNIATTDDPYQGNPEAQIVIVEFSDFQCPYCYESFPVVHEVINTYRDHIKFIYRDFPISNLHPQAAKAAQAGECANEQDMFWEMHDKLFINQNSLGVAALKQYAAELGLDTEAFNDCLDSGRYESEVIEDFQDGVLAGVDGTPAFFINGKMFSGVMTFDEFSTIIDELIAIYNQ